ncbi:hypothetical protein CL689_04770 [Candidatus Saccharibacteria bacterium]|nr:hypothetical protein [Candidatus Saccharibacteria bacterium]MBJ58513.1 hypothetical protein [Candidatus Saccharibacteria bacterium]MBQ69353.1 hypothetical protein [Candidatus Saccharibacteria bacterium]|tara:strand:+ start:282 stop:932 length:651 start_codon:yes stop_codon:yes gene_type:complete
MESAESNAYSRSDVYILRHNFELSDALSHGIRSLFEPEFAAQALRAYGTKEVAVDQMSAHLKQYDAQLIEHEKRFIAATSTVFLSGEVGLRRLNRTQGRLVFGPKDQSDFDALLNQIEAPVTVGDEWHPQDATLPNQLPTQRRDHYLYVDFAAKALLRNHGDPLNGLKRRFRDFREAIAPTSSVQGTFYVRPRRISGRDETLLIPVSDQQTEAKAS